MTICGVMKDLCIVLAAAMIFSAQISMMQGVGFATALFGVAVRRGALITEKAAISIQNSFSNTNPTHAENACVESPSLLSVR